MRKILLRDRMNAGWKRGMNKPPVKWISKVDVLERVGVHEGLHVEREVPPGKTGGVLL